MATAQDFIDRLKSLQDEQRALLNSSDRRKKAVRTRIKEITHEFFQTKATWRQTLGPTTSF